MPHSDDLKKLQREIEDNEWCRELRMLYLSFMETKRKIASHLGGQDINPGISCDHIAITARAILSVLLVNDRDLQEQIKRDRVEEIPLTTSDIEDCQLD